MAFSTISAQQLFWDFNDGTTTDLTLDNAEVTFNGTGQWSGTSNGTGRGDNFLGTVLALNKGSQRTVTMPAVNSSGGTGTLSFKMIYGNNNNGGERVDDNGAITAPYAQSEHMRLYYSTNGGVTFILHTDFIPIDTYRKATFTLVTIPLTGDLAAANIIYRLRQEGGISGSWYDHSAIDDLYLDVYDTTPPTITQTILAADNSSIAVTFGEPVYTATGATTDLVVGDFALSLSGGQATLSSPTPSSISISPGKDVFTLGLPLTGTPNVGETLTVNPVINSIYDGGDNVASTTQSNNVVSLYDKAGPMISSVSLAADNSTITVNFSDAAFNAIGGSGDLEETDFSFTISGGVATLSSSTPSSISISAGNDVFTLGIPLSGIPNGGETLTVNPALDAIYDAPGNAASTTQSNNSVNLNDNSPPIIISSSLASVSYTHLTLPTILLV